MSWQALLYPLSCVYKEAVDVRLTLYRRSILKTRSLPCRVISVGNLTLGGSGKTPVVAFLGSMLRDCGKKVAVLSRGYRGQWESRVNLVSDGHQIYLNAYTAGDEPVMLAQKLPGVFILSGKNRYRTGTFACNNFSIEVAIMDDGYQHLALGRDLNILLLDEEALAPQSRLFPAGRLREPIKNVARADIVLYNGDNDIKGRLEALGFRGQVSPFCLQASYILDLRKGVKKELSVLRGQKVLALSGIAHPHRFHEMLEQLGAKVRILSFPDHHRFRPGDYRKLAEETKDQDIIVTTEKDAVRLNPDLMPGCHIYALGVAVDLGKSFSEFQSLVLKF